MNPSGYDSMNVNVLNVAKDEYTRQLTRVLSPLILQGLNSIYEDARELSNEQNLMRQYQELLKEVPKWNNNMIKEECERILQIQDWMHDLVTAVFVTNVKILTSVKLVKKEKQFKLKMPSFETFIHAVYIESARSFFGNPFIMYHSETIDVLNKNKKDSLKMVKECIEETIRIMLPVQHILQEYMRAGEDEEVEDFERDNNMSAHDVMNTDITNNNNFRENQLKSMVQQDVNNNQNMINDGMNNASNMNVNNGVNSVSNMNVNNGVNNEVKNDDNDIENESIVSGDEEYEDVEEGDDEYEEVDDEDDDEQVRSVSINDKKSQEKIRNNMGNTASGKNSKMSRYRDEADESGSE